MTVQTTPETPRDINVPEKIPQPEFVVMDRVTGELFDLGLLLEQPAMAARIYPFINRLAQSARRAIEMDMEARGSEEWVGPGYGYTFKSETEWQVDAVKLREDLLTLARDPSSGINDAEVEESIQIIVSGKANKTKLNSLKRRSAVVAKTIDEAYTATQTAKRLSVKGGK